MSPFTIPSLLPANFGFTPSGLLAQQEANVRYEWGIFETALQQPLWLTLAVVSAVVALLVTIGIYSAEHRSLGAMSWIAALLRLAAVGAVLVLLADPMRRTVTTETTPSRVVLLVDTSLSMATPANETVASTTGTSDDATSNRPTKHDAAIAWLTEQAIPQLSQRHRVQVVPLHQPARGIIFPLASKTSQQPGEANSPESQTADTQPIDIPVDATRANLEDLLRPTSDHTQFTLPLAEVMERSSNGPLAGVVLITDGQQNRGDLADAQAKRLGERGAVLHTLGLGPKEPAVNSWIRFVSGSSRAYVNDRFRITVATGTNQSRSTQNNFVAPPLVELYRQVDGKEPQKIDSKAIELSMSDQSTVDRPIEGNVDFELEETDPGKYRYVAKLLPLVGEVELADNERMLDVEVVDRVTRVLMLASGPTRDYRFLRNQLQRDKAFSLDVYLQSISGAAQQNAKEVLEVFPSDTKELGAYDVIIAFDPDWTQLPTGSDALLEQCVNQRGTGLIIVPGPVHTDRWLNRRPDSRLQTLLPVMLQSDLFAMVERTPFAEKAQTVRLTKAGQNADFLMLRTSTADSSVEGGGYQFWQAKPLLYSCREVAGLKPAAIVYAKLGESEDQILMAEQFYGAGRSFYLGSTEFWRLRKESPFLFEGFFTKLIQHVAQGRLAAGDATGRLLFEQARYDLGESIQLRLLISNERDIATTDQEAKNVRLVKPSGDVETLLFAPSPNVPQAWDVSFRADEQGLYEAAYGNGSSPLTATTRVELPQRERRPVELNADLLSSLAKAGGGYFYASPVESLTGLDDRPALLGALPSRSEKRTVAGQPDQDYAEQVSRWTLGVICVCLFSEWWFRRRARLA